MHGQEYAVTHCAQYQLAMESMCPCNSSHCSAERDTRVRGILEGMAEASRVDAVMLSLLALATGNEVGGAVVTS